MGRERERELEAGGLGILRTGRRDIHPLVRPSRGASVRGWKGARETAEGSDRYNRDAHTCSRNEVAARIPSCTAPSAEGGASWKVLAFLLVINKRFTRALITSVMERGWVALITTPCGPLSNTARWPVSDRVSFTVRNH